MKKLLLSILMVLMMAASSFAAIGAATRWEIRYDGTANNVNGGGFNPNNANFLADLACHSGCDGNTPIVSSASYTFVAADIGAWLYVKSGTGWRPGWYKINNVTDVADHATLEAAIGEGVQCNAAGVFPGVCTGNGTPLALNTSAGCATADSTSGTFGIDYSQQTTAQKTHNDLVIADGDAVPGVVTSAAHPFGVQDVGNIIHITAGTSMTVGWYEIVSVSTVNATLDRVAGTADGALTGGTYYMGGSMSMNSTLDDDFFDIVVGGNTIHVAYNANAIVLGENLNNANVTTAALPITMRGYKTRRAPTANGNDRPTMTNANTTAFNFNVEDMIFSSTDTYGIQMTGSTGIHAKNCKFSNPSTSTLRAALRTNGVNVKIMGCEITSTKGYGINASQTASVMTNNYIYKTGTGEDDVSCIYIGTASGTGYIGNNILSGCDIGINFGTLTSLGLTVHNNTIYGSSSPPGTSTIGISLGGTGFWDIKNNIIYGWDTGIGATSDYSQNANYNVFYNNTANYTANYTFLAGANDTIADPAFTSAPTNFSVGTAMKALGYPGAWTNIGLSSTTGYFDPGAVQRAEPVAGVGGGAWGF